MRGRPIFKVLGSLRIKWSRFHLEAARVLHLPTQLQAPLPPGANVTLLPVVRVLWNRSRNRRSHKRNLPAQDVAALERCKPRREQSVVDLSRDREAVERARWKIQAAIQLTTVRDTIDVRFSKRNDSISVLIYTADFLREGQEQSLGHIIHVRTKRLHSHEGAQQHLLVQCAWNEAIAKLCLRWIVAFRAVWVTRIIRVVSVKKFVVRHTCWA